MFKRTLAKTIKKIQNNFPVLLLTGPRQVGKTTFFEMCSTGKRKYVTLDDLDARNLAKNDPNLFIKTFSPPVIIDEVQYAPNLFSYIKIAVDKQKKNSMFWLTGSQKFHLMKGVNESLAGRVAVLDLLGLSRAEIASYTFNSPFLPTKKWLNSAKKNSRKKQDLMDIYKNIWLGSFPKMQKNGKNIRDVFYSSYVQTYIQRDVKDVLDISDESTFYKFLTAIAARTGQLLNYADLARDVGIDGKTVKSWLSVLETSGLIYLLQPYYNNINKRLVKTPKLYFLDTGLCAYLTKWPDHISLEAGHMSGVILETYIFTEILKSYWHNAKQPYFYYYRDADQKEIDLVIEQANTLYPVEFKKNATPSKKSFKHFKLLEKLGKKLGNGAVICFVDEEIALTKDIMAIPVSYL